MTNQSDGIEEIISDLYAGTLDSQAWERGVRLAAKLIRAQGPFTLAINPTNGKILRHEVFDYDPLKIALFNNEWANKDIRIPAALSQPVGEPMTEAMILPRGAWEKSEVYNEFLAPEDAPYFLATWLHKLPDKITTVSFQATRERGPFSASDVQTVRRIIPHMRRAISIKDHLESRQLRADAWNRALDHTTFGIVVIDEQHHILDASSFAIDALGSAHAIAKKAGRWHTFSETAGRSIRQLISSSMREGPLSNGLIHLQRPLGQLPLSLILAPVSEVVHSWVASNPRYLLFVFDPERRASASVELVGQDLQISQREAEIAALLASGVSLNTIAKRLGISRHTARTHLKSVFAKTGFHSQADLVRRIITGPAARVSS